MSDNTEGRLGIGLALGAAILFGISAPAAKALLEVTDPWLLAGLLYLGSGASLGLALVGRRIVTNAQPTEAPLSRGDWPWLGGAILAGGVLGPVLLMFGLSRGSAAESALLLNLEGVFTALLAWVVFHEHVDRRIAAGMTAISTGAVVLAWNPAGKLVLDLSSVLVAGACLAWALDNNLTRKVSAGDPMQIAALKGLVAGAVNTAIALTWHPRLPGLTTIAGAALVGVVSYGASLVLYILALRRLGAGRTSAYFSIAPFVGAGIGVAALGEAASAHFMVAGVFMGIGVWLHVTERHEHEHRHEPIEHEHRHHHDEHHQHAHPPGTPTGTPHSHWHAHGPLHHSHPHFPDLHHRHGH